MSIQAAAAAAADRLRAAGLVPGDARRDATLLARAVLGWDEARWLTHQREPAPAGFVEALEDAVARRAAHEPLAYITGTREFFGRAFAVTADVLIPRPDTEVLVEAAVARIGAQGPDAPLVVDVGTGSGCIALSIAAECPAARVVATDVSEAALAVARRNAVRLGLDGRVPLRLGSMLAGLAEEPQFIVSNPPYVRERDRDALPPDVVRYEPGVALFGGPDGLDVVRTLIDVARDRLAHGGWLLCEIGADQKNEVLALAQAAGRFDSLEVLTDLERRPRVLVARRTGGTPPAA